MIRLTMWVTVVGLAAGTAAGGDRRATDEDINELIDHLAAIIKNRQETLAEIAVSGPIKVTATGETIKVSQVYRGTVISRTGSKIVFETPEGMRFEVRAEHVDRLDEAGHFKGETTAFHSHGGRTALATLALLSAGVDRNDLCIRRALAYLERHPMPGTYGRALRASIYSVLVQQGPAQEEKEELLRLLRRDARWLVLAMNDSGGYTYVSHVDEEGKGRQSNVYDNSNSQFGTLGVWICALAGHTVSNAYWQRTEEFWLGQQRQDGGWGYHATDGSSQNMTIAGINSLIVVLDQLHARAAGKYQLFKGIARNAQAGQDITRLAEAAGRGMQWLARNGKPYGEAYTQLGHERLGLASGEKYFGPHDWYRSGAEAALDIGRWENVSIENVSMWLLFLAYGRSPVLVNKLRWGDAEGGWDYYYRDLYHACRFLSNTYEQLYKWQIIDTQASLYDLQDAPILYITGNTALALPPEFAARLKQYVQQGGLIVGHANRANTEFVVSFKRTFEELFVEWGGEFRALPEDHFLYRRAPGSSDQLLTTKPPMWGLSDGYREAVLLASSDIAGAWHQSLEEDFPELFRLFANLRFYAAGPYKGLPGRLRRDRLEGTPAAMTSALRIARPRTGADRGGAPTVWETMNELMTHYYGVSLEIDHTVPLSKINEAGPFDLVHIAGQKAHPFRAEELEAIKSFCAGGGIVVVEALGGDREFGKVALEQLKNALGSPLAQVSGEHVLVQGAFPQGKPLGEVGYSPAVRQSGQIQGIVPLYTAEIGGRTALVFSPLDMSIAANGHYVPNVRGYETASAQKVLRNILLYVASQKRAP